MKALVGAFNQEKALVGTFSVIVQPVVEPMDRFAALISIYISTIYLHLQRQQRRVVRQEPNVAQIPTPTAIQNQAWNLQVPYTWTNQRRVL